MELRVLLIEDSPNDEALVRRALQQAGVRADCVRVETEAQVRDALKSGTWDAIISDFNLPELDAPRALALVKGAELNVPFIIVSGTVGERAAVEAMRAGAHDYVMKDNLTRLPEAIRREVKEAQLRKERRSLEDQVRQAQKMEAVGQLAGSVAHDFNNLLTVIMSFTQFVHDDMPEAHPSRQDLREVVECANRAAGLTRQLLAFSRKSVWDPQLLDLNLVVASSDKMLRRLLGPRIDFVTLSSKEPAYVFADRGLVEQVIVNLVVNARDAMPEGGKLTVELASVPSHPERAGPQVLLAVTDTGVGMSEDVQRRLFEPFFTTKGPGQGTGLGLVTVRGIVRQCGGEISAYSAVGRGTTFKVYLPAATELQTAEGTVVRPVETGGSETVLVVEDQDSVRLAVQRTLSSSGYRVLEASRPRDAIALVAQHTGPLDLLLTDLVLPDMDGQQLAGQLRATRSSLASLYMSGFAGGAMSHQGVVGPGTTFLQKPFTPQTLLHKVRVALDTRKEAATPR
jgi:signal transduction histidine kinase